MSVSAYFYKTYLVKNIVAQHTTKGFEVLILTLNPSMLYQLHATVFKVEFMALVATCHADLFSPLPNHMDKTLSDHYWRLEAQIADHCKRGLSANYTYPWPMISIGFNKYQALNLFNTWKMSKWNAFGEEECLINSPIERKTVPSGGNLYESLKPIRRLGLHALLMVRLSPEEKTFSNN